MAILSGPSSEFDFNGWYIQNNLWDTSALDYGYSISGTYNPSNLTTGLKYSWDFGALPAVDVHAFPNIGFGLDAWSTGIPGEAKPFPLSLANLAKYQVHYDVAFGGATEGYNVALEMYLTSSPGGGAKSITNEVMVWLHDGSWHPGGSPVGSFSDSNFSGQVYSYPVYQSGLHLNYTAILTNADDPSGTIDLRAIMQKLKSLGIVKGNEYISNLQLGAEVAAGKGSLAINKLQLDIQQSGGSEVLIDGSGIKTVTGAPPGSGSGSGSGSGGSSSGKGLAAGVLADDFNGDGRSDVVWVNDAGQAIIWTMNGTTKLAASATLGSVSSTLAVITAADFAGDGKPELLAQDENGQAYVWTMNGLTRVGTAAAGPNPGSSWRAIGAGDFNGDNKADILWRNDDTGAARISLMNGTTATTTASFTSPGANWDVVSFGDVNGNGKADLVWQNVSTGQIQLWTMDGVTVTSKTTLATNPGSSWHVAGTGDFNDDGNADILLQNANGTVRIWEMKGASILAGSDITGNPGSAWKAVGARDFNGDGKDDILFQNSASGQAMVWTMNGFSALSKTAFASAGSGWHAVV